ncbi:MAG: hypothetical protein KY467_16080 [Gemmatimonadetes bacterium]|nr:hypothetical protein [Gemmatimonadota bacterium]
MLTTRPSSFLPRPRTAAVMALALAAALASCGDPLGPDVDRQETPFYYSEDQKIYLTVYPARLTVVPEVEADTGRIRTVLTRRGLSPDSIRPMHVPRHWFVHLPPRTSARRAEDAARWLRLDTGVRFASAAYRRRDLNCPLFLVNRLVARFRPDADPEAIERLNRATGVRNEQVNPSGVRWYEYPPQMAATPLELAAHYHRQPITEWADADRMDSCLRIGVGEATP